MISVMIHARLLLGLLVFALVLPLGACCWTACEGDPLPGSEPSLLERPLEGEEYVGPCGRRCVDVDPFTVWEALGTETSR